MPDKLTDSEIVKALECKPKAELVILCNHLQTENERLMRDVFTYQIRWAKAESRETKAKAEAYKEFADKMDEKWLCGVLSYAFSDGYAMDNKANIEELSKFLAKKIKELAGD